MAAGYGRDCRRGARHGAARRCALNASADITLSSVGGEYMESAVLVEWHAAEGARVAAGDVVAVVETAKAATEIEAPAAGVLRILVSQGEEVAVGTVLGRVGEAAPEGAAIPPVETPAVPLAAPDPISAAASAMPRRWQQAYAKPAGEAARGRTRH